jgi:hypothetical protein
MGTTLRRMGAHDAPYRHGHRLATETAGLVGLGVIVWLLLR